MSATPLIPTNSIELIHGNRTLFDIDTGKMFITDASTTFTLPDPAADLTYVIAQFANADMVVQGNANLIVRNNQGASSVAFQTSGQKIGSIACIKGIEISPAEWVWWWLSLCNHTLTIS